MLTIRAEQMRAFEQSALLEFRSTLPANLIRLMPDLADRVSSRALKTFTENSIDRALSYGFKTQRDIYTYVSLDALLGEGTLEGDGRTLAILTNNELPGSIRAELLLAAAVRLAAPKGASANV